MIFLVITAVGEGLTLTLFVPWVRDALHSDSAGYGAVLSTQAIGGLTGAIVIGRIGSRINPLRMLIVGALVFGAIDLVLFTYPVLYPVIGPALVMLVIVGVPGAAIGAAVATLEQIRAQDRQRGRVVGAIGAVAAVGSLVGAVAAGFAGEVLPVVALLVVQGSGYVIGGLVVAVLTRSAVAATPCPATENRRDRRLGRGPLGHGARAGVRPGVCAYGPNSPPGFAMNQTPPRPSPLASPSAESPAK